MFNKLKIRYWILAGYSIPIILMIASSWIVFVHVANVKTASQLLDTASAESDLVDNLWRSLESMQKSLRGHLLDPNNPTSLENFKGSQTQVTDFSNQLARSFQDKERQEILLRVSTLLTQLKEFNQSLINLTAQNRTSQAISAWKTATAQKLFLQITEELEKINTLQDTTLQQRKAQQEETLDRLVWVVWIVCGFSAAIASILGWLIIAGIARRMNESASDIASSSSQIAAAVAEQERVAAQQAASVQQTTTTMDELNASSRQAAEQAEAAAAGAKRVLELADGDHSDRFSLNTEISLRNKVRQIVTQIQHWSEQTVQISTIANLVSEIANQTNMLALNASVEAARAGVDGKGFSVIATEIRKLADQSRKSAEQISKLVIELQNGTYSTVSVAQEGTKTVDSIVGAINEVVMNAQQISLNAKQQAIAIDQVVEAMNNINAGAQQTVSGISQTKGGTQQLNQTAQQLQNLV